MSANPTVKTVEDSLEAFKELVRKAGAKSKLSPPSKFIKKLDEIPSLELSPEDPCNCALFLAERTLIGKFTGLWPSPKTVEAWIEERWRPMI